MWNWFLKILKTFFFSLDSTLFKFIKDLYELLMDIANSSVLTQGDIASFVSRVELLLGIFMLFRVSISLITYIVSPDSFSDTSKGFGKLIQNTIISLVMLVTVPYIFQIAYNLQAQILEENVLAKIIFGSEGDEGENYLTTAGDELAFYTLQPFFKPNTSIDGLEGCINLFDDDGFNDECETALLGLVDNGKTEDFTDVDVKNYSVGMTNHSLGLTFRLNAVAATLKESDNTFIFDYPWPISTVAGVVICLLLISFCLDIGLRSVKLAFLQLIYPIPVIAFMDPKSGKDGIFKKWYQMCFSTYLSLFVRMFALFFGLFIIQKVGDLGIYDVLNGSQNTNGFVYVFIIIGVLMFAKQLPKILENFGLKLDGDGKFTLNPIKKVTENAAGGKQLVGVPAGAAMGLGIGAVGTATGAGKGKWFTGMMGGVAHGLQGKKFGEMHKSQVESNQRMREAIMNGSSFRGRLGARFGDWMGTGGESTRIAKQKHNVQDQLDEIDNQIKAQEDLKSQVKGTEAYRRRQLAMQGQKAIADSAGAMKKRAIEQVNAGEGTAGRHFQAMMRDAEALKGLEATKIGGRTVFSYKGVEYATKAEAAAAGMAKEQEAINFRENDGWMSYAEQVSSGHYEDGTFTSIQKKFDSDYRAVHGDIIGHEADGYGGLLKGALGGAKGAITDLEIEGAEDERQIAEYDTEISRLSGEKQPLNDQMRELQKREEIAKANTSSLGKR